MKATLFRSGGMGMMIAKTEIHLVDHGTMKYAQYPAAPFITFKKKRSRKTLRWVEGFQPYAILVEGWDVDLEPDGLGTPENQGGVIVTQGRYPMFDSRWQTDFDTKFDKAVEAGTIKVIADYRHTTAAQEAREEHEAMSRYAAGVLAEDAAAREGS